MDGNVRRERPVLGGILLAAGLVVVLVIWFGRACFGGWWLASGPSSSDTYMLSTIYERWAVQVKGGHLPLWFPEFAGGGYPVHAAWMYGLFYPPIALFLALPPEAAWTWLAIVHIVFGALGMYAFLWDERRDVAAAACGAIVFALSNFMMGRLFAGHVNLVMPLAWSPWILRAAARTVRGGSGRDAAWLAICTALGLLSGHVQIWFYVAPLVAAFALLEVRRVEQRRRALLWLAVAAVLALGITAIQWMPAWELFNVSGHPPEDRAVVEGCSATGASLLAQLAPRLTSWDEPFAYEWSGLGGPLAVVAVLFAFRLRDGRRWFWFVVLAVGLVVATGLRNDVGRLANELPPFRWARAPGRAMCLVVLAGGVLAGHAVADFASRSARWRRAVPAAFVSSALALGMPTFDVVRNDFYEFDWSRTLPATAKGHRVHVLHGRYPYLERSGVSTLRDVCPLDTPEYKAMSANPSPTAAWRFDVGAEVEIPWDGRPPGDAAATAALAERSRVKTFEGFGAARMTGTHVNSDGEWAELQRSTDRLVAAGVDPIADFSDFHSTWSTGFDLPRSIARGAPNKFELDVDCREADVSLAVAEKKYPGWRATVDGVATPTVWASGAFLGVGHLTAGVHHVVFEYRPEWLTRAFVLVGVALLLTAALIVDRRRADT